VSGKVTVGSAEHYTWGSRCDGWHLVRQSELSVIRERMPAGTSEVRHFHQHARQFFFVLAGTALLEVDGMELSLAAGEGCEVVPGTPHQMFNRSQTDLEFLVVSQPPSHGDRILSGPNED
jgi:mannose-6-phosphate isomerase-like protein (cupin superfamily)